MISCTRNPKFLALEAVLRDGPTVRASSAPSGGFLFKLGLASGALCEDSEPRPGKNKGKPAQRYPVTQVSASLPYQSKTTCGRWLDGQPQRSQPSPGGAQEQEAEPRVAFLTQCSGCLRCRKCPGLWSLLSKTPDDRLASRPHAQGPQKECAELKQAASAGQ